MIRDAFQRRIRVAWFAGLLGLATAAPAATSETLAPIGSRPSSRTSLWCQVEGESASNSAALSPAAWKDLKGAGFDGVALEGHSGIIVAQSREAGLETTTGAALQTREDGSFTSATLAFLRGDGDGSMPSAFARAILNHQKSARGPVNRVPADALVRSLAGAIFHPVDPGQSDLAHETLSSIIDTILIAIPGDLVWPQSSIQKTPSSAASRHLLEARRGLLRAHAACSALRDGVLRTLVADDQDQVLAFARILRPSSAAVVIVNNTERQRRVTLPGERLIAQGTAEGLEMKLVSAAEGTAPAGRLRVSPNVIRVSRGQMEVDLAPRSAALFVTEK